MFIINLEIAFISKFPSAFEVLHGIPVGMLAPAKAPGLLLPGAATLFVCPGTLCS